MCVGLPVKTYPSFLSILTATLSLIHIYVYLSLLSITNLFIYLPSPSPISHSAQKTHGGDVKMGKEGHKQAKT